MPRVEFSQLPDDARLWVFGAASPVVGDEARALLDAVDGALSRCAVALGSARRAAGVWSRLARRSVSRRRGRRTRDGCVGMLD